MTTAATTRSRAATNRGSTRANRLDRMCAEAVDVARAALPVESHHIGEHVAAIAEGERLVTHLFECLLPGYRGWRWAVTVTRIARSRNVTVCEVAPLPGPESMLAPAWVPWRDRLRPGDLGVGDLLPTSPDDERLVPGYVLSDDPEAEQGGWEPGLGRPRALSRYGRTEAAQRWYDSDRGPHSPISEAAPSRARCGSCGFYLPLSGVLGRVFGACANEYSPDDGGVVSVDHGCGAHSEVLVEQAAVPVDELPTVYDDGEVEPVPAALAGSTVDSSAEPSVEPTAGG